MSARGWVLTGLASLLLIGAVLWIASGGLLAIDAARRTAATGSIALDAPRGERVGTALPDPSAGLQRPVAKAPAAVTRRLRGEAADASPRDPAQALASFDAATARFEQLAHAAMERAALPPEEADPIEAMLDVAIADLVATHRVALEQGTLRGSDARDAVRRTWTRFMAEAPGRVSDATVRMAFASALAESPDPAERR